MLRWPGNHPWREMPTASLHELEEGLLDEVQVVCSHVGNVTCKSQEGEFRFSRRRENVTGCSHCFFPGPSSVQGLPPGSSGVPRMKPQ